MWKMLYIQWFLTQYDNSSHQTKIDDEKSAWCQMCHLDPGQDHAE